MNFDDTPAEAEFRAEARAWIAANAPLDELASILPDETGGMPAKGAVLTAAKAWQKKKAQAGWACLTWPKEYGGRGATPIQRVIWDQEEGVYAQLNSPFQIGQGMCAPTMMAYATEEQKKRYVPPLASGEEIWCQLFSEPAAGSDLAGLRTKAEKHGDEWVINGQKIWTTGAHFADYGILITRTDPTLPKHKGLTMFFIDMKAPGVEVRPIKQASGTSGFNEVYFNDLRVPDAQRLGAVNDGWNVSLTVLMNERFSIGARVATAVPEFFDFASQMQMADGTLAIDDPAVRSKLANWVTRSNGLKYTSYRAISALSRGERPGPENSIGKLVAAPMAQDIAIYAADLQGPFGATTGGTGATAALQSQLFTSIGMRIAGGTDEVMRNIIAERVLGLPADVRVDKNVPFKEIPTRGRA